jgi:hypothetical protein
LEILLFVSSRHPDSRLKRLNLSIPDFARNPG